MKFCLAILGFATLTVLTISVLQNEVINTQFDLIHSMMAIPACVSEPPMLRPKPLPKLTLKAPVKRFSHPKLTPDQVQWLTPERQQTSI